jgi:hypothetical protein
MAIRYAVANGNWSNTATWDGGTLPSAGDIIFLNNRNVDIDVDITLGDSDPSVNAGSFLVGHRYRITSVGNTSWTTIGAAANTVDLEFTATGVGSGTGTALQLTTVTNASNTSPAVTAGGILYNRTRNSIVKLGLLGGNVSSGNVLVTQGAFTLTLTGSVRGGTTSTCSGLRVEGTGAISVTSFEMATGSTSTTNAIVYASVATSNLTVSTTYFRSGGSSTSSIISLPFPNNTSNVIISSPNSFNGACGLIGKIATSGTTSITIPTISSTAATPINISSGGHITIVGNLEGGASATVAAFISLQNSQNLTITGNIYSGATSTSSSGLGLTTAENNTVIINGNIIGGRGVSPGNSASMYVTGSVAVAKSTITVNGDLLGPNVSGNAGPPIHVATGNPIVTINGNMTMGAFGDSGTRLFSTGASAFLIVEGNVTGSGVGGPISFSAGAGNASVDIKGNLTVSGTATQLIFFQPTIGTNTFRVRGTTTINIPAGGTAFAFGGSGTTFTFDLGVPPIGNTYNLFNFSNSIVYTYTGNVDGSTISNASSNIPIILTGTATLTINGNVTNRTGPAIRIDNATCTCTINGNVSSSGASPSTITQSGVLIVNGNVTATLGTVITSSSGVRTDVNGIISCSDTNYAISAGTVPTNVIGGRLQFSPNGRIPISGERIIFPSLNTNDLTISVSTNGVSANNEIKNDRQWVASSATPSDVRSGTVYGAGDVFTGTCAVPPAGSVLFGVPVDNTTGTVSISAEIPPTPEEVAEAVRTELATELARIDAAVTSRLATADYTTPPSAATNASAVRTELATELARIDANVSSAGGGATAGDIADAVRLELAPELAYVDAAVSSRLATTSYAAPDTAATVATAVRSELGVELARMDAAVTTRLASANYDAPIAATTIAGAVRTELATELARIDIAVSDATTDVSGIPGAVRTELATELAFIDAPISTVGGGDNAATVATAVRTELATELARIDAAVSSRLATAGYTAPDTTAAVASAVRNELATELARIDTAVSTRLATTDYISPETKEAIAVAVEAALLNEGDGQQLIDAILQVINTNLDLPALELTAIANAVRSELATELARIDANVSTAGDPVTIAGAVRTELATELARVDAAVSTRLASAGYTSPPAAATVAGAVRTELAVELARIDIPISEGTEAHEGDIALAVRAELATELARIDIPISDATTDISGIPADVRAELAPELERIANCSTVDTTGAQLAALL